MWTNDEIIIAINLIENGSNFKEISNKLNKTHVSVTKKMNRMGYKSCYSPSNDKGKTKYIHFDWLTIQKDYDCGLSYKDIRKKYILSTTSIIWAIKNNKLKMRSQSDGLKLAWKNGKFKIKSEGLDRYRQLCKFKFSLKEFPNEFDFKLIETHGWYKPKNRGNNLNGVSRDHMFSVKMGYDLNISPYYISHPSNCKLMIHNENSKKHSNSTITIDELYNMVNSWDLLYLKKNALIAQLNQSVELRTPRSGV